MEFDITFSAGFGDGRMVSEVPSVFVFQEVGSMLPVFLLSIKPVIERLDIFKA